MSYIDTLEEAAERALAASESAENSAQIMNDVANGNSTTTVDTANGPVDTVAKAIVDIIAEIEGGVVTSNQERVTVEDDAQTTFSLNNTTTSGMALYIEGSREFSFTINSSSTFTISEPVPAGTQMYVVNRTIEGGIGGSIVQVTDGDKPLNTALTDIEDSVQALQDSAGEVDNSGTDTNVSDFYMIRSESSNYKQYTLGPRTYEVYVPTGGAAFYFTPPSSISEGSSTIDDPDMYPEDTVAYGVSYTTVIYLSVDEAMTGEISWDENIMWIGGEEPELATTSLAVGGGPPSVNILTFSVTPNPFTGTYRVAGAFTGVLGGSSSGGGGNEVIMS